MYVTRQWGSTGVRVDDDASDEDLGQAILDCLSGPALSGLAALVPADGGRTPWQIFCEDVAGVSTSRFRPEKRVRALRVGDGWRVDAVPYAIDSMATNVPDTEGLRGLGTAVRRELASFQPRWPAIRQTTVMTTATRRLVVMPDLDGHLVGPARVLGPDATAAELCDAVRAAVPDAITHRASVDAYPSALSAVGVDQRWLDGGAQVTVSELSDGTVRLTGHGTSGNRLTDEQTWLGRVDDMAAACGVALKMIRRLPTQHLPPDTPTGVSFGYKCCWLAVRSSDSAEVADAVRLADERTVDWGAGVHAAYAGEVFVSPPTREWVFVVSAMLPFDGLSVAALSAQLATEVQYFGTHRISDCHEWAYANGGSLVRRMVCDGSSGVFEQRGTPTQVEIELGIPAMNLDYWQVSEDDVMQVAAAWSLDPTTLHLVESSAPTGVRGTVRRRPWAER
ncbi:hypothetical protein ACFQO7_24430 [Catellatospora aurea]|uniref:Ribosomal protein S12 methylthiotransferase accessory factor n=1 Tax=Catellatospora aurea TaxID=1337874 RepID=A0ABW2H2W4_9ACTN